MGSWGERRWREPTGSQAAKSELTTNGYVFDTRPEAFGELRDANGLLEDPSALRQRMAEDGYLLLRGYLDRDLVLASRLELAQKLADAGLIDLRRPLIDAVYSGSNLDLPRSTARRSPKTSARAPRFARWSSAAG